MPPSGAAVPRVRVITSTAAAAAAAAAAAVAVAAAGFAPPCLATTLEGGLGFGTWMQEVMEDAFGCSHCGLNPCGLTLCLRDGGSLDGNGGIDGTAA